MVIDLIDSEEIRTFRGYRYKTSQQTVFISDDSDKYLGLVQKRHDGKHVVMVHMGDGPLGVVHPTITCIEEMVCLFISIYESGLSYAELCDWRENL